VGSVELKIEDVAFGGKGVGRENGKAIFVPFTIDGERVSARIVREKKSFAEAELLDVLEESVERTTPECPYFGRCGGCSYQYISYQHQLELKSRQVEQAMRRIGRLSDPPMRPIVPSPLPYAYRNRITVHAEDGVVGFYRRDEHRLIDIERCPIAADGVNRALAELRAGPVRDGHYTLRASSGARVFSQTNDAIVTALRDLISQLVPDRQELLIDAYCGAGFFAKALLEKFERVVGIDWDRFAVAAARKNATVKETYIAGDIEEELRRILKQMSGVEVAVSAAKQHRIAGDTPAVARSTTVIVDPPASGLCVETRRVILDSPPRTMIYVSCNPPTLARDLAELRQAFQIESITPLDMFPQTAEIEVAVHLTSGTSKSEPKTGS
jgi:23S rRNA (uracil1939-C5)-methyltransferase